MASSPNEPTAVPAEATELTESDRFRLLSVERRRIAVDVLSNCPSPVSLDDVALAVASREQNVSMPDPADIERVAVSLHHHHLPKMDAWGVVDYDATANRIR